MTKAVLRLLGLFVAAMAVGTGCFLVDARAHPVLWHVLWGLCVVCALVWVWLEWGIWPRWVSVVSILVFYAPTWVGIWLNTWGYVSDDAMFWIDSVGLTVMVLLHLIVGPVPEDRDRTHDGTVVTR